MNVLVDTPLLDHCTYSDHEYRSTIFRRSSPSC